jgi:hypothetical protein
MRRRRQFLTTVTSGMIASAGCIAQPQRRESNRQQENDKTNNQQTNNQQSNNHPLPGEPVTTQSGELPVMKVKKTYNFDHTGFDEKDQNVAEVDHTISKGDVSHIEFHPVHAGVGKASGTGTVAYQTAWEAPKNGTYLLKAQFHRWGTLAYNYPSNGNVMSSFDVSAQLVQHTGARVIDSQRFQQHHQSSNDYSPADIAEFAIETGLAAITGYALGLGIVGRAVLGQIIDRLVDLDNPGGSGDRYDVNNHINSDSLSPYFIGAPLEVEEGATLIFEVAPLITWSYKLNEEDLMEPHFQGGFELEKFIVEPYTQ